jgi:hypothetical protein
MVATGTPVWLLRSEMRIEVPHLDSLHDFFHATLVSDRPRAVRMTALS